MPCKQRYATREEFIKVCLEKGKDYVPSGTKRPVRCVETGVVYESVSAAAEAFGKCTSNLSRMCKQTDRDFACYFRKGKVVYHFRYADQ